MMVVAARAQICTAYARLVRCAALVLTAVVALAALDAREAAAAACGNGTCQTGETCFDPQGISDNSNACQADCGICPPVCNDTVCEAGESCSGCPGDCGVCPAVCGSFGCEAAKGETCSNCAGDCGVCPATCGDLACNGTESSASCPSDCGVCGNGTCAGGENCNTCPDDCGNCAPVCPNSVCQAGETCGSCPTDCGDCVTCGDGTCDVSENCGECPGDCGSCDVSVYDCPADMPVCSDEENNCCYKSFAATSLIIPMDRCHQTPGTSKLAPPTAANSFCVNPSGGGDDGMFQAYGLVYRAMQQGIPVYWLINPVKDPPKLKYSSALGAQAYGDRDIDFWVLSSGGSIPTVGGPMYFCGSGCTPPVLHMSDALVAEPGTYIAQQFPVRGGAFVIAAEDRARFAALYTRTGEFASFAGNALYDFSDVEIYEVQAGATFAYLDYRAPVGPYARFNGGNSAPVAVTIDYPPPRLARQSPAGVSETFLAKAKLNDEAAPGCASGAFSPTTAVYCDVTLDDVESGVLTNGGFTWAWFDRFNAGCEEAVVDELHEFMTAIPGVKDGHSIYFMEGGIELAEDCSGKEVLGGVGGVVSNGGPATEPFILRYPADVFLQVGDVPPNFAQGSPTSWNFSTNGYQQLDSLRRLVSKDTGTLCNNHVSSAVCDAFSNPVGGPYSGDEYDVAVYARYKDVSANGIAFYMGGNNVTQSANSAQLRMIMNAILALPAGQVDSTPSSSVVVEVSRSAPVVTTVDAIETQFQGTISIIDPAEPVTRFDSAASVTSFQFPHFTGHMRAIDSSSLSSVETEFDDLINLYDADEEIPGVILAGCGGPPYTASCRNVFTTTTTGALPAMVQFTSANTATLQPLLEETFDASTTNLLMTRILSGRDENDDGVYGPGLGGVDRSTLAVVEPSPLTGDLRPTMLYFGAMDGMLHAVCAEVLGPCARAGQELWAFLPRTVLPMLRHNLQRMDGSPKVAEVYGDPDPDDADGPRFHTVLTFQTGWGSPGFVDEAPATIAIDVSDPARPVILWEHATPATRTGFETGVGLGLAMGPVKIGSATRHLTFAQTTNGGTAGVGFVVSAIDSLTGEKVWQFNHVFASPRSVDSAEVPSTGMPGGVAAFSKNKTSMITHVVAPSLYGDLWLLDAATGVNEHDSEPLFRFTTDYHPIGAPPSLFVNPQDGKIWALAVSGGYADPVATNWAPAGTEQYVVAMSVDPEDFPGSPFSELTSTVYTLAANRAYAQAVISGNEVYVVTDETDVNNSSYGLTGSNTGTLTRLSLTNLSSGFSLLSSTSIPGGSSSVDVTANGVSYSGSGRAAQKNDFSGDFTGGGASTELAFKDDVTRLLWIAE